MTGERIPRRKATVPDEPGTIADIGAISATDSAFDRIAQGERVTYDDPALRLFSSLSHDVRTVPPPAAWQADDTIDTARRGRTVRVGRRTALTGVGAVAVSVLCAVGVAAATGIDPVSTVTDGRVHLAPAPAITHAPARTDPRRTANPERKEGPATARTGGGTAPSARPTSPPHPAPGNGRGHGAEHGKHKAKGRDNGKANGPDRNSGADNAQNNTTREPRSTPANQAESTPMGKGNASNGAGDNGHAREHQKAAAPGGTPTSRPNPAPSGRSRPRHGAPGHGQQK